MIVDHATVRPYEKRASFKNYDALGCLASFILKSSRRSPVETQATSCE